MTKIQIELPEATAKAASEAALLMSESLDRLLIDAEVKAVRAGRRRASGH